MHILELAVIALLAQNGVTQPLPPNSIHGSVVKAGTSTPLSKAIVEVHADSASGPVVSSTVTDSDGRFLFRNVRPGRYLLVVARSAYVRRLLAVIVGDGQDTPDAQVAMTSTVAISGRISGTSGEPIGNVEVQALKPSYPDGRRVLTPVQSVRSDDRGEYRLFWLPPGRYYVNATHPTAQDRPGLVTANFAGNFFGGGGPGGPAGLRMVRGTGEPAAEAQALAAVSEDRPPTDRYVPVYFPGTIDEQAASAIDLKSGADVAGVDIPLAPVHAHHVRGVVINGATGQVAQYAGLRVANEDAPAGGPGGGPGGGLDGGGDAQIDPDGSFDLTLFPGSYTLIGTAGTGVGYVSLQVRDADIDGVQIVALPAFNIPGRIVSDGGANPDLEKLRISLRRDVAVQTSSSSYSLPRPDGSFVVEATPGDFRLSIAPLLNSILAPPFLSVPKSLETAYVKSIRLGDVDVLNGGLHVDRPPASPLEIVIGTNPGVVDGTVLDESQSGTAGATVALLPDVRRRFDLYRATITDSSGRFHLDHVPPGDYRAFAWEEVSDGAWQDPEFVRADENRGTPVHVGEGTVVAIRLTAIPPQ